MAKRKSTEDCIIDFENKHGKGRYDYRLFVNNGVNKKSIIICPIHQKQFLMRPNDHLTGYGCPDCGRIAAKQTCLINYGTTNPSQSEEIKKKKQSTLMTNFGVDHNSKIPQIKIHKKQTCLVNHGVEHALQSEEIHNKMKTTMLLRHGVEHALQSEEIQNKRKASNIENHGCEYHQQKNMIDILPLLQSTEWLEDQYYTQQKTLAHIGKEIGACTQTMSNYAKTRNIKIRPNEIGSSIAEQKWIEGIMESEGIYIQYEGNGGQFKIPGTNWRADGYCVDTNTIYEFHGSPWHGNPRRYQPDEYPHPNIPKTASDLYQKTKDREQDIIELGYNLVVMWDDGFTYNIKGATQ